jgi:hypothetical protein
LESVLAGGNRDGGIQLRPDGGGTSSSAGEQLAVTTAVRHWFPTAMGSRLIIFVRYIRPSHSLHVCLFSYSISIIAQIRIRPNSYTASKFGLFLKDVVSFFLYQLLSFSSELSL